MRALIQRVSQAKVRVKGELVASINQGLLILLAIHKDDSEAQIIKLANKIIKLRIFEDDLGKMNLALPDVVGEILLVSQFTLYADTNKGNRPSFMDSARPEQAKPLYLKLVAELQERGVAKVATGRFGVYMEVSLINDGPTTILLDI